MIDKEKLTRRQVVAGLGTGLAAAVATPVLGAGSNSVHAAQNQFAGAMDLEDPTTKYPKPPFKS